MKTFYKAMASLTKKKKSFVQVAQNPLFIPLHHIL